MKRTKEKDGKEMAGTVDGATRWVVRRCPTFATYARARAHSC